MTAVVNFFKKLGDNVADAFKKLPNAFYVLIHPFEGYYDLKHDPRKKSVNTAILIYILLAFSAVFKRQLTGYLFTSVSEQLNLNVLIEIGVAVLPYILWTIANWCFSSLMDGDGKFSDIFVATAVGTLPIIIANFISVPFSHLLDLESDSVYTTIVAAGVVIAYIEIFLGMITIHQYSVGKGIATAILSIVGIMVIAFIVVLVVFLVQQVTGFASSLWTEISYRFNE